MNSPPDMPSPIGGSVEHLTEAGGGGCESGWGRAGIGWSASTIAWAVNRTSRLGREFVVICDPAACGLVDCRADLRGLRVLSRSVVHVL